MSPSPASLTSPSTTILVVDDDDGVRRYVGQVLQQRGYAVEFSSDGPGAIEAATTLKPDLLILDLTLPELGGLAVCERLRTWYQGSILVLSGNGEAGSIVQALDLGADDYLVKPFRTEELLARIRALLRRAAAGAAPSVEICAGGLRLDLARRELHGPGGLIRLTRTEFDILAFLAKNADRVVTSESILREVWGPHHGEYAQTLRVHVGHIRKKIEQVPSAPKLLLTEPGVGYRFNSGAGSGQAKAARA